MSGSLRYAARGRFDPETADLLAEALEAAWNALRAKGEFRNPAKAADTRTLLAKYLIEIAGRGERDRDRLHQQALIFLNRGMEARRRYNAFDIGSQRLPANQA